MRSEGNPLDLNNFPDDYTRDGKQVATEDTSSSSGCRKKKGGGKEGKEESGKVYECRFCSLKFCKSQALGGHMNRHRQERETETLNRARQLVFSNDNLAAQAHVLPHHLGGQPIPHGGYHQTGNIGDPGALPFRPVYPTTRLFPGSPSTTLPPPPPHQASYMYTSPSYPSQYSPHGHHPSTDYFLGHVLSGNTQYGSPNPNYTATAQRDSSYTCIGAPVGHAFPPGGGGRGLDVAGSSGGRGGGGGRDVSLQHLDPALNNRFQDGF